MFSALTNQMQQKQQPQQQNFQFQQDVYNHIYREVICEHKNLFMITCHASSNVKNNVNVLLFVFIGQKSDSTFSEPMDRLLTHIKKRKMTLENKALYNTK